MWQSNLMNPKYCERVLKRFRLHAACRNHSSCKHFGCEQFSIFRLPPSSCVPPTSCSRTRPLHADRAHAHTDTQLLIVYHFSTLLHNSTHYQEKWVFTTLQIVMRKYDSEFTLNSHPDCMILMRWTPFDTFFNTHGVCCVASRLWYA